MMALVLLVCYHNSIRVRSYLLRAALVPPSLSPWRKLYDKGDSSSFLHVIGLTREEFDSLLYVVISPGHTMCRRRRGGAWSPKEVRYQELRARRHSSTLDYV